jgi:hypothetical protein
MTCRVARSFREYIQREPVCCSECGSTYLEVVSTSSTLGPYLCASCARSLVECEAVKDETSP